jgi:hypothetical protein
MHSIPMTVVYLLTTDSAPGQIFPHDPTSFPLTPPNGPRDGKIHNAFPHLARRTNLLFSSVG